MRVIWSIVLLAWLLAECGLTLFFLERVKRGLLPVDRGWICVAFVLALAGVVIGKLLPNFS